MGPKKAAVVEVQEEKDDGPCRMAYILITDAPPSSNPNVTIDPTAIVLHINVNARLDIVLDFIKRSLVKKLAEQATEYAVKYNITQKDTNGDTMGSPTRKSMGLSSSSFEAADGEGDAGSIQPKETESDVAQRTIANLKAFQQKLQHAELSSLVLMKMPKGPAAPAAAAVPAAADSAVPPVLVQATSSVSMTTHASTIITTMTKYEIGVSNIANAKTGGQGDAVRGIEMKDVCFLSTLSAASLIEA